MAEKKMNKWVFMLLATLFNLALVLGFFVIFMVIASLICNALAVPDTVVPSGSSALDAVPPSAAPAGHRFPAAGSAAPHNPAAVFPTAGCTAAGYPLSAVDRFLPANQSGCAYRLIETVWLAPRSYKWCSAPLAAVQ